MNLNLLMAVAEAVGLDASQGAILHRSHRGHWEIHGHFIDFDDNPLPREVSCVPWEGSHSRSPDDNHNGIQYIPALRGVEDPDRALEIIAAHMKVGVAGSVNTINFDRVALWKAERKAYNALNLRTAHIVLGGETVTIPPNVIEEWRFMGLNNTDLMEFWDGTSDRLHDGLGVAGRWVYCPDCGGSIPEHQHHGYDGPEWRCPDGGDPHTSPETPLVGTINASEVTIVDTITGTVEM